MQKTYRNQEETIKDFPKFDLGWVDKEHFWTNIAIDHEKGLLTNDKLLCMMSKELRKYAFTEDGQHVFSEWYKRPSDPNVCRKQCEDEPNSIYEGAHRAKVILEYREAMEKKANENKPFDKQAQQNVFNLLDATRQTLFDKGIIKKEFRIEKEKTEEEFDWNTF